MKLDYNIFPLDIYNQDESKSFLRSIEKDVKESTSSDTSASVDFFSSLIIKLTGAQLLALFDDFTLGNKGYKAKKCFSNLIREQINRIKENPNRLQEEAQLFLMTSLCISRTLCSWEERALANSLRLIVSSVSSIVFNLSIKKGFNEYNKGILEIRNKYDDICQVYFIAFLLWVYNSNSDNKELIRSLIKENMCDDEEGNSSFQDKKRPILFSNVEYKSISDNLHERIDYVSEESKNDNDLYKSFIKYFMNDNNRWLQDKLGDWDL